MNTWLLGVAFVAASSDLQIADKYFKAHREGRTSREILSTQENLDAAAVAPGVRQSRGLDFDSLPPLDSNWSVEVQLTRPPRGIPHPRSIDEAQAVFKSDLRVDYRVIERVLGPMPQWRVELSCSEWAAGLKWQQEFSQSGTQLVSHVRPCRENMCGPWRRWNGQEVFPTAGRQEIPSGFQAPLFLSLEAKSGSLWQSEDFFGREVGVDWREQSFWPERMWSAQGEARLVRSRGAS